MGALVLDEARKLALLSHILTALSVEALCGTRGSFDSFIHQCRPHPSQIESANLVWNLLENSQFATLHEEEVTIEEDKGELRQE